MQSATQPLTLVTVLFVLDSFSSRAFLFNRKEKGSLQHTLPDYFPSPPVEVILQPMAIHSYSFAIALPVFLWFLRFSVPNTLTLPMACERSVKPDCQEGESLAI
jgi:hypothetical protein